MTGALAFHPPFDGVNDEPQPGPARRLKHPLVGQVRVAVEAAARGSGLSEQVCRLCAEICETCATECERFEADGCRRCAEACRARAGLSEEPPTAR